MKAKYIIPMVLAISVSACVNTKELTTKTYSNDKGYEAVRTFHNNLKDCNFTYNRFNTDTGIDYDISLPASFVAQNYLRFAEISFNGVLTKNKNSDDNIVISVVTGHDNAKGKYANLFRNMTTVKGYGCD